MKKISKYLSLVFIALLLFGMTACGEAMTSGGPDSVTGGVGLDSKDTRELQLVYVNNDYAVTLEGEQFYTYDVSVDFDKDENGLVKDEEIAKYIINALAVLPEGLDQEKYGTAVPEGVCKSATIDANGVVTLDLDSTKIASVGTTQQGEFLNQITGSFFGSFSADKMKALQFTIDGKKDVPLGDYEFTEPIQRPTTGAAASKSSPSSTEE